MYEWPNKEWFEQKIRNAENMSVDDLRAARKMVKDACLDRLKQKESEYRAEVRTLDEMSIYADALLQKEIEAVSQGAVVLTLYVNKTNYYYINCPVCKEPCPFWARQIENYPYGASTEDEAREAFADHIKKEHKDKIISEELSLEFKILKDRGKSREQIRQAIKNRGKRPLYEGNERKKNKELKRIADLMEQLVQAQAYGSLVLALSQIHGLEKIHKDNRQHFIEIEKKLRNLLSK